MTTFKQLGLSTGILEALEDLGFETPTTIQEKAIPQLLDDQRDFIGLAQTGTGKTAAFGLPLLNLIDPMQQHTQALILAPTRELGQQIAEQIDLYSKYLPKINVLAVYGGAPIHTQIRALKRPQHIIIATPGRLIDLIKRKSVRLEELEYLVLDEADEMLNMGFKEELDRILSYTPSTKLTWLFSATMPAEIKRIVNDYMTDPLEVKVDRKNTVNSNIDHQFTFVNRTNKSEALTRFLDVEPDLMGVVFCRTKRDTRDLAEELVRRNYKADALHGDLSQPQRDRVMKRFKDHQLQVLIATDVAARGIDVNDLTHVFHYNLPDSNAYYTHRSGRTARAGKKGISIAFISSRETRKINSMERELGINFTKVRVPSADDIVANRMEQWCQAILDKNGHPEVGKKVLSMAENMFEDLSKEELIRRLMMNEMEKLNLNSHDLNASQEKRPQKRRPQGRDRKYGRRGAGRSHRKRDYGRRSKR
ncbi:MAG: DEAD/DEAH box helicase [Saprospiraceae bacterium]|nr:DEAD/DEAH box helicase [Saprospiraceae bacterium]